MKIDKPMYFTEAQLRKHSSEDGKIYIAHEGVVYDVTDCPKWRTGMHEQLHFPGQDLTGEIADAPHTDNVFTRPFVKPVGYLIN